MLGRLCASLGRFWVGLSVCLSVCLSVYTSLPAIQTSRGNCQTTHLLSLDVNPTAVHFKRSYDLTAEQILPHLLPLDSHTTGVNFEQCFCTISQKADGNHFTPLLVLTFPPNWCQVWTMLLNHIFQRGHLLVVLTFPTNTCPVSIMLLYKYCHKGRLDTGTNFSPRVVLTCQPNRCSLRRLAFYYAFRRRTTWHVKRF